MKIAPSILAADLYDLRAQLEPLRAVGAEIIHVDVMDGQFVPNISFGLPVVRALKGRGFELDVHLMIERPERYIEQFISQGASYLTVHCEAVPRGAIANVLKRVRVYGAKSGLSLRPNTPVADIAEFLPFCDLLLIMTVPPGFASTVISGLLVNANALRQVLSIAASRLSPNTVGVPPPKYTVSTVYFPQNEAASRIWAVSAFM
ncbi:hypothetical protein FACS18949_02360 [Clostridia bacterium]|nr:hypothetical protein FACS18949_02360 [Clostridia bacterium]